eukprot:NODE_1669_length_1450_cov_24.451820_g1508_i0.p1 GENE.NODE_1669_length_1450_cov_24.451820_g1508_i0~~NODE_1669_length_1450_cov_24.451820_g1508_i0.p1  ORF type:complete len:410 (-),score=77.15 NODE_1669_length_1450_cov_24.451820_g1508_i0:95-1324(-)
MAEWHCSLSFGEEANTDLKVFQVTEELLAQLLACNNSFVFKGEPGGDLALCSSEETYAIRSLQSSNTLLVVPELSPEDGSAVIQGTFSQHYELTRSVPRPEVVRRLLSEQYYKSDAEYRALVLGSELHVSDTFWETQPSGLEESLEKEEREEEEDSSARPPKRPRLMTRKELQARVPYSERELDATLANLHAIETPLQHIMLPEPETVEACLDSLLTIGEGSGWNFSCLSESTCIDELSPFYDPLIISNVLQTYGLSKAPESASESSEKEANGRVWCLDATKVCLFRVRQLFQANASWPGAQLLEQWNSIVPSGIRPSLEMLRADAILETVGSGVKVAYFPRDALPCTPRERFAALFDRRSKWPRLELLPFIEDLCSWPLEEVAKTDAFLAQHCREHKNEQGVVICIAL